MSSDDIFDDREYGSYVQYLLFLKFSEYLLQFRLWDYAVRYGFCLCGSQLAVLRWSAPVSENVQKG